MKATLSVLEAEIAAASQQTSPTAEETTVEAVSEFATDEPQSEYSIDEISVDETSVDAPESAAVAEQISEPEAPPVELHSAAALQQQHIKAQHAEAQHPVSEPSTAPVPGPLQEFVSDLESSLGEGFLPGTISHEAEPSAQASAPQSELEPVGNATPTAFGVPDTEPMGEFVADLEASLGDDFLKGAPVAEPESAIQIEHTPQLKVPMASTPTLPRPLPAPPVVAPAAASAAAAASSGSPTISAHVSAPVTHHPAPAGPMPHTSPVVAPPVVPSPVTPGVTASAKASPFGEDAGIDLAEMFGDLKHDLEAGSSATDEDPETHYNLGIAFREMGLLDEAIGELQKTCQAVDRGHPFPQVMQTYTWLAQCFLDKGLPEAAIRWYDKALHAPGVDEETRTALHYELAAAYETAGDKTSALKHFMEVYGRNIDYRDVAERIKPLKS